MWKVNGKDLAKEENCKTNKNIFDNKIAKIKKLSRRWGGQHRKNGA